MMVTLNDPRATVADAHEDLSSLGNAPRGTVIVIHENAYCKGSEQWYWLPIPALTCECRGYEIRGHCFHADCVRDELRRRDPCPVCRGAGTIEADPNAHYVTNGKRDTASIPRLCCDGAGTRRAWEEGGRLGVVRVAGMTEEERLNLFR